MFKIFYINGLNDCSGLAEVYIFFLITVQCIYSLFTVSKFTPSKAPLPTLVIKLIGIVFFETKSRKHLELTNGSYPGLNT